ncbi:HepT-like ribonuclease domain-containing protein [uncultured Deinococcus sp.]|uniref:HepT-like ribonuclease domain-containing protein n=1 Tax=uncultured Deinococcus sp. TaxID=158789 RepID=UPI002585FF4A|nr:HepT-like ribonuclease domain-containing protein [uncultured Deinococcus sp.]
MFGSVARGEAWGGSDIDLLVDFAPGQEAGLLDLMRVKALCEDLLGRRVDVLTEAALKAPLRGEILADAVDVTAVTGELPVTHRPKRWRWRVYDLLDALDRLQEDTAGLSLTTFLRDERTRDAVLRNLARLGETTKFIPQSVQDRTPDLPWAYLRDIRNLISHDYFGIAPELVWHTLRRELPPLRPLLQALAEGRLLPGPDRVLQDRTVTAQAQTPPVEVVGTRPDAQAPQVHGSAERERQ